MALVQGGNDGEEVTLELGGKISVLLAVIDVPLALTIGLVNFVGAFIPYLDTVGQAMA